MRQPTTYGLLIVVHNCCSVRRSTQGKSKQPKHLAIYEGPARDAQTDCTQKRRFCFQVLFRFGMKLNYHRLFAHAPWLLTSYYDAYVMRATAA